MAANEICLKDIMTDCSKVEAHLEGLKQQRDDLYNKSQNYYTQYMSHPPVMLREYLEAQNSVDTLQEQLTRLQKLSLAIIPEYQASQQWLEKAKQNHFECEINLFKQPHTQRNLNTENNVLASSAPVTTLRFVYADNQNEVVDNGYIFYWVYDEYNTEKIEDDSYTKFTEDARPMLPVGVGRTDGYGYLRKSTFFKQETFEHLKNDQEHYIRLGLEWNNKHTQLKSDQNFSQVIQAGMKQWNVFGQLDTLRPFYLQHAKANRKLIDTELNETQKNLQQLYAFHLSKRDFDKAEALIKNIKSSKTRNLIRRVSNEYFYLTKPYGFMCYPIDRGSFVSKDLHALTQNDGQQSAVAWKGYLVPEKRNDKATIAIHCTLPEWDRRIQKQLERLRTALDVYLENQKDTQTVLGHLDGMLHTCFIHKRFAVNRDDETVNDNADYNRLINNIEDIKATIETAMDSPKSEDNQVSVVEEAKDVEEQALKLRALLNSDALLEEFKRYWQNGPKDEKDTTLPPGPYMQEEPYWVHFFYTYCQAIIILRHTSLSVQIFTEEISPFLDRLIAETDFSELLPGADAEKLLRSTNKFFAGQSEEEIINTTEKNIQSSSLTRRLQELSDQNYSEDDFEYEEKENLLYIMFKGWKTLGGLFHRVPGPPSVLQVILDVYADHIARKIQREALQKGSYHIKLMLMVCQRFGVFGNATDKIIETKNLLYTALRAHGRMHAPGGDKPLGGKNYYSHSAIKERINFLSGKFDNQLTMEQKKDLETVFKSQNRLKELFKTNFYERPFPGFGTNIQEGKSFSDSVYTASDHFFYKGFMAVINLGFMLESWINLPEQKTRQWDEGDYLHYIASVSDTLGNTVLTAYTGSKLVNNIRLAALADRLSQGKKNVQLSRSDKALKTLNRLDLRKQTLSKLSPFMDHLAVSLNLLAGAMAIHDGFDYQDKGQSGKALNRWLQAAGNGLMAYGFYAGKYAEQGALRYLEGQVARRTAFSLLSRFGAVVFLPFIGEAAALGGAILIAGVELHDLIDNYLKSTLLQRFEHHFNAFHKLDDEIKARYYQLKGGKLKAEFQAIGEYDGLLWAGLDFDNLSVNAVIPLQLMGWEEQEIKDMLENNDYRLLTELRELYERVSQSDLSEHYYIIEGKKEYFAEIAKKLENGTFFKPGLSHYQQREQIMSQYARYNEYPRP